MSSRAFAGEGGGGGGGWQVSACCPEIAVTSPDILQMPDHLALCWGGTSLEENGFADTVMRRAEGVDFSL